MSPFKYFSISLLLCILVNRFNCYNSSATIDAIRNFFRPKKYCYDEYGCFPSVSHCYSSLFGYTGIPFSPKTINPKFLTFTKSNAIKPHVVNYELNSNSIKNIPISGKNLIFIVHGYASNYEKDSWMDKMKNLILKKSQDYAVICVDWAIGAGIENYQVARANARVVGAVIGLFLVKLQAIHGVSMEQVRLIGHSLGAHVIGYASKKVTVVTGLKVGWLTGLDPAGPCFFDDNDSLRRSDAWIVEIIHTDIALFGSNYSSGHCDVFINNGEMQPTCLPTKTSRLYNPMQLKNSGCDHIIVTKFYLIDYEEYGTCQPVAYACSTYEMYLAGLCNSCKNNNCRLVAIGFQVGNKEIVPDLSNVQTNMYLKTSKTYPFCSYFYQIIFYYGSHFGYQNVSFQFNVTFTGNRRKTIFASAEKVIEGSRTYFLMEIPENEKNGGTPGPLMTASIQIFSIPPNLETVNITKIEANYMSNINEKQLSTILCPQRSSWAEEIKRYIGKPNLLFTNCLEDENQFEYDVGVTQDIVIPE